MSDESVYCGKCGAESFLGAHFCMRCGGQLSGGAKDNAGPGTLRQPAPKTATASVRQNPPAPGPELDDIDRSFDSLVAEAPPVSNKERPDPRQAFRVLAQEHLRPIRDFMIELEFGDAKEQSIPICSAAIEKLRRPAGALGSGHGLMTAIGELSAAFARLKGASDARIAEERAVLKRAYGALIKELPRDISHDVDHAVTEPAGGDELPARANQDSQSSQDPSSGGPSNHEGRPEYMMDNGSSPKEKRTVVEEGSHFKGTLSSSCPVDVRGRIDGEVETPSLTVSSSGAVHGLARVEALRSQGELAGEFDADTVELSGVVKDNTVVRARSMQVKLSSDRGKLQVVFGECELPAAEAVPEPAAAEAVPEPAAAPAPDAPPAADAEFAAPAAGIAEAVPPVLDPAPDAEARTEPGFVGDETGTGRRSRRQRGSRHSEPPPAMS